MADGRTELEIRIRTIAEEQGIKLTEQGLQRLKEKTQEVAGRTNEAAGEFKGFTAAQKEQAQQMVRNIEATEKAAKGAASLGRDVNTVKGAFSGLRDVIGGALNGNLLQVGSGFGKISAAVTNATPAVQTLFGAIARGAAAASVVVGPVLVLVQAMKMAANDAEAAMKRWWDEAAKGAEAYRQASAQVKSSAAADLAELTASVQRLADSYSALIGRMNDAEKRSKAVSAAQKELELAKAGTPEERAVIEAKFASNELDNEVLNADLRERNAIDAQNQGLQEVRNAEANVRDAEATFATNPTRANQDAVAAAKANLGEVQTRVSKDVIAPSQSQIEDARLTREVSGIKKQTLSVTTAKGTAKTASGGNRGDLRAQAEAAQASGDFAAQDRAVAELRKLNNSASGLSKAIIETGATTSSALDAAAKDQKKQQQRQANTSEARASS
ncbi:MAG TPA: hypothetical protein VHN79_03605 [Lacunisphaera sp.]|nr:hypothetical protein [Lacunisphaera sp.]